MCAQPLRGGARLRPAQMHAVATYSLSRFPNPDPSIGRGAAQRSTLNLRRFLSAVSPDHDFTFLVERQMLIIAVAILAAALLPTTRYQHT
jgi:hypothetical protein